MSNATQAVVDGRMEPINKAPETQQLVVTGQYLFDNFVQAGEEQISRMNMIRDLVNKADPLQIKGATDEMVKIAIKKDVAAGIDEKERGPKRNTAMNVRTIFQQVYGALKFAPEQMEQVGFTDQTGWLEARVMAKTALQRANKVWNGYDVPSMQDKEQAALGRARKGETDAQLEATKSNPRGINESFESWQARIAESSRALVEAAQREAVENGAKKAFEYVTKKYDRNVLALLATMLTQHLVDANTGASEVSEQEANAMLAAAEQAGAVEIHEEEGQHVD